MVKFLTLVFLLVCPLCFAQSFDCTDSEETFVISDPVFCLSTHENWCNECTIKLSELKNMPGLREAFMKMFEISGSARTGDINYLTKTRSVLNFYLVLAKGKKDGYEAVNTPFYKIVDQLPSSILDSFTGDVDSDNVSIGDYLSESNTDRWDYSEHRFIELARRNFTLTDREEILFAEYYGFDSIGTLHSIGFHHAYYDNESKNWKHLPIKHYEAFEGL